MDSLNANYSFKYLGKDKGVSVVTFIDMRDFMWHSTVISSSEKKAAYVIDGLMHNDVTRSDIQSTDMNGYSEVISGRPIFCILGLPRASRDLAARNSTPSRTGVIIRDKGTYCYLTTVFVKP